MSVITYELFILSTTPVDNPIGFLGHSEHCWERRIQTVAGRRVHSIGETDT